MFPNVGALVQRTLLDACKKAGASTVSEKSIMPDFMKNRSLALGAFLLSASLTQAAVIPVPGGDMQIKNPVDGQAKVPAKWTVAKEQAEHCSVWLLGERNGFLAKPGLVLETTIDVPALTEKESSVKGIWTGIAHLDCLGTPNGRDGQVRFELATEGSVIAGDRLILRRMKAPSGPDASDPERKRLWVVLSPEETAASLGKKLTLRITVGRGEGVVLAGASLCRLHSLPSKKLFGRSNGGLGPDLLGAGSLGFDGMTEHKQHALPVMTVRKGGPADAAGLKVGDVILDVNGQPLPENDLAPGWEWFGHSHESTLGRAVQRAHAPGGFGRVTLGILRDGEMQRMELKVPRAMNFTTMQPEDDPVAAALHRETIEFLVRTQRDDGSWSRDPIRTTFSALALMATRDQRHAERIKKAVDYLLNRYPEAENFGNLGFWHAAYAGILYSEYHLATGDPRVLARLDDIRDWALTGTHTSKWGMPALGHGIGGLPYGQKALMAPLAHLLVYEALATRCGMTSGIWEELMPYIEHSWSDPAKKDGRGKPGHGAMGYNASYKDLGEFWSRSGLCAMACELRGTRPDMRDGMTSVMRERHPWIRNSHAYGEPGGAWGLLGLNLCNPGAHKEVIAAYGWWFALAWEPGYGLRFTTPHMGAPYMGTDDLINATYALVLAAPRKTLHLTGASDRNWLDVSHLATAVSAVRVKRDQAGLLTMAGRIPGPEVRYTLDGSEPGRKSLKYAQPIPLPGTASLKACVIGADGKPGPVGTWTFAPAKGTWKVVAASGHADPAEAVRRASRAIDGDPNKCWLTDVGQDAAGFPHFMVIDLGEPTPLRGLSFQFADKNRTPGKWVIKASLDADTKPDIIANGDWPEFATTREISFAQPVEARYLRIEAVTGTSGEANALMIRELDMR